MFFIFQNIFRNEHEIPTITTVATSSIRLPSLSTITLSSSTLLIPTFSITELLEKAFTLIDSDDLFNDYNQSIYFDRILERT